MTYMTRLVNQVETMRRRLASSDGGFAMLSVVMLLIVMTVLSLVVLAVVLSQVNPTLLNDKNGRTLTAAQAGLDAAASQIRNAESADGSGRLMGDIHKLPCSVRGTIDTVGGETSYVAGIQYFVGDPAGRDQTWRDANALRCYTGTGINGGVRSVPRFAIITSEGIDATATSQVGRADRVVEANYTFQLTTRKVAGGKILDANSTYCLVATTASELSYITYQPANSPQCQEPTELNSWTWAEDYMIHLSSTDLDGRIPLCLSGRPIAPQTQVDMRLRICTTTDQDPLGQRFEWWDNDTWMGQNAANTGDANPRTYVVNADSAVDAGDRLAISTSAANRSTNPLPAVGKGNASYATQQIVNYNQFGRCVDVTNEVIDYAYMIAYPCKQDPSGAGNVLWNHKWFYSEPLDGAESVLTRIKVIPSAGERCLITTTTTGLVKAQSPLAVGAYRNNGLAPTNPNYREYRYPRFLTPTGGVDCTGAASQWTRYGYSNDNLKAFTIQDTHGRCLSTAGPRTTLHTRYSSIIVEDCTGSDDQKWNVDPDPVGASLGDFVELASGSAE